LHKELYCVDVAGALKEFICRKKGERKWLKERKKRRRRKWPDQINSKGNLTGGDFNQVWGPMPNIRPVIDNSSHRIVNGKDLLQSFEIYG